VDVYSQRLVKFKLVLKITSTLFLIWAVFSKIDGMDGVANVLLFISGSIIAVILVAEYAYERLVKWGRSIRSI
jgi:UDP-N-acetylmuramyl pentapeptide phosphotransferase/UDP-N-acetylglucosamine-1-phosphate transferase